MRHFKYLSIQRVDKAAFKKRVSLLEAKSKRNFKIRKFLNFCNVCLFAVSLSGFILFYQHLFKTHVMHPVLQVLLRIFVILCILIVPVALCVGFAVIYFKTFPYDALPTLQRSAIKECTLRVRQYYKLGDDYIITKCYDCTNRLLINKDVILFIYKDKLRIINDFTSSIKDFGCYELSKEELHFKYEQRENKIVAVIYHDAFTFVLGKRAIPFIKRKLLNY